jgi:M6 family metalloprotease-like protein
MKKLFILLIACFCIFSAHAAYLRNIPMTVNQPDGTVLHCFASGDEFFNFLHDSNGYTIIQHPETGYYVYAEKRDGKLAATNYVAGIYDPASKGLEPYTIISPEEWMARRQARQMSDKRPQNRDANHGTLNNLSIFIRFADDPEFTNSYSSVDNMFNDDSENAISMRTYFRAASYGAIEIPTTFYPGHDGDAIISYQDIYPRSYYRPYNSNTNPNGYHGDSECYDRELSLLERAVNYVNDYYPVPSDLNIDYDDDGLVDNICFIIKGNVDSWTSLLWPHQWWFYDRTVYINGKQAYNFNFQLADATDYFNTSVMCHEMNHSLGAPDLYRYSDQLLFRPVGPWDLMDINATPPQHCGVYMKMKYGHWIDEIPEITQAGTYTLNPVSSATPTNVAYKIRSNDPNQFYVLEYRDNTSLFETSLPGSGLLIYRIDTRFEGNQNYNPSAGIYDEVYVFRPGGTTSANGDPYAAHFSSDVGRTEFSASTNPHPFLTNGTLDNSLRIYNITSAGSTISFSYGSECEPPTHLVASVEDNNVTLSWDAVTNAVSYKVFRNGTLVSTTSETTYLDSDVASGFYTYYLRSIDANEIPSDPSETVTVSVMVEGGIVVGDGGLATNTSLPTNSYYNYSLTQQIYTADELGEAGVITGIAFYLDRTQKTRTFDLYMKSTTKSAFSDATDWETVSDTNKVFSGSVTMAADAWTLIPFDTPFIYDGTSNIVLVTDDNTNSYTTHMSFRVFDAPNQSISVCSVETNFDPVTPQSSYYEAADLLSVKNQIILTKEAPTDLYSITVSANPAEAGTVSGGGSYRFGETCTVTATPIIDDYSFVNWTQNGEEVSTEASYSFIVTNDVDLVANFSEDLSIGEDGSNTGSEVFGFINDSGSFCIFDIEGAATLQVVDVMGRILSSESFNGSYEKRLDVVPGVYMLRLINGNNVKVRKIVIE